MKKLFVLGSLAALPLLGTSCVQTSTTVSTETPDYTITLGDKVAVDGTLHPLMLGVISGPQASGESQGADLTQAYKDIGVTAVRNNDYYDDRLDMAGIFDCGGDAYPSWDCSPSNPDVYNWELSDSHYSHLVSNDFVPFLRIGDEFNGPSSDQKDFIGPQTDAQEANFIGAAKTVVGHYVNFAEKKNAFTYLDLWTEFPGPHFWDRPYNDFYAFWGDLYQNMKASYPGLKIGGPGFLDDKFAEFADQGEKTPPEAMLSELYKRGIKPDWLSWHYFGNKPQVLAKEAQQFQDLLDGTGDTADVPWAGTGFFKNTEVFIDAYNSKQRDEDNRSIVIRTSGAERAARLTAMWIGMQYADIQGAFYYRGNEMGATKNAGASQSLFNYDGSYTTAAHAFKLWSTMTENYPTLISTNIPASEETDSLWAMAAENEHGEQALLLSNIGKETLTISIPETTSFTAMTVNDRNDGTVATPLSGNTLSIPSYSVVLLEIKGE